MRDEFDFKEEWCVRQRQGFNNAYLKNRNRGLVLQAIACGERASRIDIARRIGLTKMTVTNIVGEWIAEGVVAEREAAENAAVGRNPVLLDLGDKAPLALGLYISRSAAAVILADLKLEVVYRQEEPLADETARSLAEKLFRLADGALKWKAEWMPEVPLPGIGVSAIGPMDAVSGVILHPTEFFGIREFPVAELLTGRYRLPVFLNNDMNAAALAEQLYGRGRRYDNFFYLGITNGIGSGIVSGGRLYQDSSGFVGEIGHMSIDYNGPVCSCGNRGCLEVYANMPVIRRRLRAACPDMSPEEAEVCEAGREVLSDVADKLSIALTNAVNLLDPQLVLVGHEGARLPGWCLQRIQDAVNNRILAAGSKRIVVLRSAFGEDAPLLGSACCVWQALFAGRLEYGTA